jgi:SAM-dependent methyltransferase
VTLSDPEIVRAEYADEEALLRRSVYRWAVYEGPDPREHALLALLEARPRRLLDAGCGTGELAERAAAVLGCDVVGVDQSERMLELARARGVEAVRADVVELPFHDGSFDAVSASWMLYHLPDVDRALRELRRVLRPGGRLVALQNDEWHLAELWGRDESGFPAACEAALRRTFGRVDRRDVRGAATFATREALLGYLGAFDTLHGRDERGRANAIELPLRVTCHNVVLVAERGR